MSRKKSGPIQPCYRALGARIETMRTALGWTQEDLAKKLGFSRPSIVLIEAGKQRVLMHTIEDIARGFGCTPKHLLRGVWC